MWSWRIVLTVRLIRVTVALPGFRSQTILIATSLLDPKAFPRETLADLHRLRGTDPAEALYRALLFWIAHDPVPDRPNRIEPRAVKRRPKEYDLLNKPRSVMRRELMS